MPPDRGRPRGAEPHGREEPGAHAAAVPHGGARQDAARAGGAAAAAARRAPALPPPVPGLPRPAPARALVLRRAARLPVQNTILSN